jgi:hypothetical protein
MRLTGIALRPYPWRMGTRRVGSYWALVLLGATATGCTSTRARCETLCDWVNKCSGLKTECSDSQLDECVDEYNDKGNDCQDAFDDFADCLDDHDMCEDVENHCVGEAAEFNEQC